jgi:hypothetical protein
MKIAPLFVQQCPTGGVIPLATRPRWQGHSFSRSDFHDRWKETEVGDEGDGQKGRQGGEIRQEGGDRQQPKKIIRGEEIHRKKNARAEEKVIPGAPRSATWPGVGRTDDR